MVGDKELYERGRRHVFRLSLAVIAVAFLIVMVMQ